MGKPRAESSTKKVILVTGASSGIGRAASELLVRRGHVVLGTSRRAEVARMAEGVRLLPLDVDDGGSVERCVEAALRSEGRIDVLVANAGRMVFGPAEEVPLAEAHSLFETNFWGAARVVNAVLPGMRARGEGTVILVGSIAGDLAIPLNAYYAASKAALARYAEALRHELRHLGVRVSLVTPGDVRTALWDGARVAPPRVPDYEPVRAALLAAVERLRRQAADPADVARVLADAACAESPRPEYRVGAMTRRLPLMRMLMPARVFEEGLRRAFGIGALTGPAARPAAP